MTDLNPTTKAAYIAAARNTWHRDGEIEIDDNAQVSRDSEPGAYVQAWVRVYDHDLERDAGPSYDVWITEPDDDARFSEPWRFDQRFTCEDDPEGRGARRSAHAYARYLRRTYPCAYVAVRPSGKTPLPPCSH